MAVLRRVSRAPWGRDYEFTLPVAGQDEFGGRGRSTGSPAGRVPRSGLGGQGPGSCGAGEPEAGESAQVEPGGAVVQPLVVGAGAAEAQSSVAAADQPGDGTFDHRAVLAVDGLEPRVAGAFAVRALRGVVGVQAQGAPA